jgi:hypothetical protein
MIEMGLPEILQSLYVIEPDALKVWLGLQKAYPAGSFMTIIEDLGGGKVSEE